MKIRGVILPGAERRRRRTADISPEAKRRLTWMDRYHSHGENARRVCRHFSIPPNTFYRWLRRYRTNDLSTLENRSRRPRRLRQPVWRADLTEKVFRLR